ncbi:MAG: hypothetical protein AAGO57_09130, partial [Pseudomonadota bacterium]
DYRTHGRNLGRPGLHAVIFRHHRANTHLADQVLTDENAGDIISVFSHVYLVAIVTAADTRQLMFATTKQSKSACCPAERSLALIEFCVIFGTYFSQFGGRICVEGIRHECVV